jgi:hypothetical protein
MSNSKQSKATGTKKGSNARRSALSRNMCDEIRELEMIKETEGNREALTQLRDTLTLWARYMMELGPTVAAPILRACFRAWRDNRDQYGESNINDPRDQQTVAYNSTFVDQLKRVFDANSPAPIYQSCKDRQAECRRHMEQQIAQMAARLGASIPTLAEVNFRARPKRTLTLGSGWHRETSFGLHRGDQIEYVEAKPEELRRGDFTGILDPETKMWVGVGYFEDADALNFNVMMPDGSREFSRQHGYETFLILAARHGERFKRPKKGEISNNLDGATAAKVSQLKSRLDDLGDDITDSTERFKIEKELYDLEREATLDEWPDVIDEQGRGLTPSGKRKTSPATCTTSERRPTKQLLNFTPSTTRTRAPSRDSCGGSKHETVTRGSVDFDPHTLPTRTASTQLTTKGHHEKR